MAAQFTQHDIDEQHLALMRRMMDMKSGEPLPPRVVEEYFTLKRWADRIRLPFSDYMLLMVLRYAKPEEVTSDKPAPDLVQMIKTKELAPESTVYCKWRNKPNTEAKVVGVTGDGKIIIRPVGKFEEYNVSPENVSLEPVP